MTKLIIKAGQTEKHYWADLWRYRELFGILAWRDIAIRYKQTAVGAAWALIQPLLTMLILTIIFGRVARLPTEGGAPYPLLVLAGLLPWQFFANSLSASSQSLVTNSNLISKVYFPRMIIPTGAVVTSCVDFAVTFVLLGGIMAWYRFLPPGQVAALPLFMLMAFLGALGPGLLLTALTVRFRDFKFIIPFIVQFGLYVSPVGFSSSVVPEKWRLLYAFNPIVGVIDGFRWSLLGAPLNPVTVGCSAVTIVVFLGLGVWYFRKTERTFADII